MIEQHSKTRPIIKAASACVWRGEDVLLVQRASSLGKGLWSLPGGKLEPGETLHQAALRELHEETGVQATLQHEVGTFHVELQTRTYAITCFTGPWTAGEAVAGSDACAAQWLHHLGIGQLPLAPNILAAVATARKLMGY
jgi:8-oxo-dGTP diphosphatase